MSDFTGFYVITEGEDGPVVAGPYAEWIALLARRYMHRTLWMRLTGRTYWVIPADQRRA